MAPTLARPRLVPPKNIAGSLMVGIGVAAVLVVAAVLLPGMRLPAFVSRLTVANPTGYSIEVDVTTPQRDGWLGLGGFPPETTRAADQVLDEGGSWVFRFSYAGQDVGQMAMSRDELKQAHWQMTIPAELGDRLAAAGVPKSARG